MTDLAVLYSLGGLTERDARLLEGAVGSDPNLPQRLAEWYEVTARIGLGAPAAEPPAELRGKLLREVNRARMASRPLLQEEVSGIYVLRSGQGKWRNTPFPGVTSKLLYLDKQSGLATTLLKLEPGALYPPHHHTAEEQCYVLNGDVRLGDSLHLHEGDFTTATPGTTHGNISSDRGCVLLLISSIHDEIYD